jgi:hypothetical protein
MFVMTNLETLRFTKTIAALSVQYHLPEKRQKGVVSVTRAIHIVVRSALLTWSYHLHV